MYLTYIVFYLVTIGDPLSIDVPKNGYFYVYICIKWDAKNYMFDFLL